MLELLLHIDRSLLSLTQTYHEEVYIILFLIVFCETGLVVTPFLPGDSLLFAAGALAATGALRVEWLLALLLVAAVAGDSVNYWAGRLSADRISRRERLWFINQKHLDRTHEFYERYGNKTIIMARFVPIVRTLAPFVAGVGRMSPRIFAASNVVGGALWVGICISGGYFWGNLPFVKNNFSLVILGIIFVSLLPAAFGALQARAGGRKAAGRPAPEPAQPD